MRDDNESLLQRMLAGAVSFVTPKSQIRLKCSECGVEKMRGDQSPCGSHPVLPDPEESTFLIRIGFVKPKPALEQPKVERVGRSEQRQVSNRFKDPIKTAPVKHDPVEERVDDIWAEVRNQGAYRRRDTSPSEWGMSSKELARRQDRADGFDVEPEEPDVPTYSI